MLTPASRHRSICFLTSLSSVPPTFEKPPLPPNVIVPIVSTETFSPDRPKVLVSMKPSQSGGTLAARCDALKRLLGGLGDHAAADAPRAVVLLLQRIHRGPDLSFVVDEGHLLDEAVPILLVAAE